MGWKTVIAAVGLGLVLAGSGYADMMWPDWHTAAASRSASDIPGDAQRLPTSWNETADGSGFSDLSRSWGGNLPEHIVEMRGAAEAGRRHVLADERGSLTFCLYALLGLGFCKSGSCLKRMSCSIPEWYHDAGPFQIGHSLAISPDCLKSAPVHCFIQPDCGDEPFVLQYRRETIVCLWRRSQFTPAALASRGPPFRSFETA